MCQKKLSNNNSRGTYQKWKTQRLAKWSTPLNIPRCPSDLSFRFAFNFLKHMMHREYSWSYAARYQICLTRLMRALKLFTILIFVYIISPTKIDTFSFVHSAHFEAWKVIYLLINIFTHLFFTEEIKKIIFLSPKCSLLWCGYHWRRDIWNLCCMAVTS